MTNSNIQHVDSINTCICIMHLHLYLLVRAKPRYIMPRRQINVPFDEEISTPPTPSSSIVGNHGRIEVWFEGH